ncbi:hypothetical protein TWF506_003518 [Arthrobotrys conoides]|uniref:Mitochondrial division protein 1 n=1 Tax=Arthrobotrys conoides TaxID=74498 RepID=A0AAN8NCU3_9PEZI
MNKHKRKISNSINDDNDKLIRTERGADDIDININNTTKRSRLTQNTQLSSPASIKNTKTTINPSDIHIAIICALPLEASVIETLLDERCDIPHNSTGTTKDTNAYSVGKIGSHNVVITHMPRIGKVAAAVISTNLHSSFQNIQLALVVGICGGTPTTTTNSTNSSSKKGEDIFLGDVVISKAVVQYDFGRRLPNGRFLRKDGMLDNLPRPCLKISAAIAKLETRMGKEGLRRRSLEYLGQLMGELGGIVEYPGLMEDRLFKPGYRHKHHGSSCDICLDDGDGDGVGVCDEAMNASCEELGCDEQELVLSRGTQRRSSEESNAQPAIHFGIFASGDTVMKSGEDRDRVATQHGVIAFEMEAAGVWECFPTIIIKGVCDYADSHKSKRWQGYAAATAAAVMKAFLEGWRIDPPLRLERREPEEDGLLEKLLYAPGAAFDSNYREGKAFCHPSTRTKLLQDIYEWKNNAYTECVLWLNGMAGTGKSTIAGTVAKECAETNSLAGSFFFSRGEGDLSSARKLFTTLARQLVYSIPGYKEAVFKVLSGNGNVFDKNLAEQWRLLIRDPLSLLKHSTGAPSVKRLPPIYVFVIDALDECDNKADVEAIIQLFARAKEIKTMVIKVFITSRPELSIQHNFQTLAVDRRKELILHDVETPIISNDIAIFLRNELGEIGRQYKFPSGWPGSENIQRLVEQAAGVFIYAATICSFVKGAKLRAKSRLNSLLTASSSKSTPSGSYATNKLDELYSEVLATAYTGDYNTADEEELAREFQQIIGAIVVLFDSLDSSSLALLVGSETDVSDLVIENLGSVLRKHENGNIQLIHPSFRDFLLNNKRCTDNRFWIDGEKAHGDMTRYCLDLLDVSLRKNMCGLPFVSTWKSQIELWKINNCLPPHVRYACRYWVHHLCKGRVEIEVGGMVHRFLQCRILYWFEALSLMGVLSEGILMIESLLSILELKGSKDELYSLVYSAKRFILFHRSVIEAQPLQVYWSCLLFSPTQCMIRRQNWDKHDPPAIKSTTGIQENWDSCLQVLEGHSDSVSSVAFSSNGKQLGSGSRDKYIILWDTVTGVQLSTLKGHSGCVQSISFSRDGRLLASGSEDGTIKLWNIATGACVRTLRNPAGSVLAVVFSDDGRQLASSSGRNIALWDAIMGTGIAVLKGHTGLVRSVAFSCATAGGSGRLASGSDDGTVKIWDTATGVCLTTLKPQTYQVQVWSVAFSHDGQKIASSSGKNVILWDAITGTCHGILEGHADSVWSVAFSFDGKILASGSGDGVIIIWNTDTKKRTDTIEGHRDWVASLQFSYDGKLASSSGEGRIKLWDTSVMEVNHPTGLDQYHLGRVRSVAFSPDGKQVASCSGDKTIEVASGSGDRTIKLWDTTTGTCIATLEGHSGSISSVVFSSDGKQLISGSEDRTIMFWDVGTGGCTDIVQGHLGWIRSLAVFDYGAGGEQLLASGADDTTIKIWDMNTRDCSNTLKGHSDTIWSVVFSKDGKQLASSSNNGVIMLWDMETQTRINTLRGPLDSIWSIAFSPDGSQLVSGFDDGTIISWDTATGARITMMGGLGWISYLGFLRVREAEGVRLVSSSGEGSIRVWNVDGSTFGIDTDDGGDIYDYRDVLLLPSAFSPSAVQVCEGNDGDVNIAIGFASGQVFICRFSTTSCL